jgi:hypothetical protein
MPAPLLMLRIEQRGPRRERLRWRLKFLGREDLGRVRLMFVEVGVFGFLFSFAVRVRKGEFVERGVEPDRFAVHEYLIYVLATVRNYIISRNIAGALAYSNKPHKIDIYYNKSDKNVSQ